ncbi:hypothetical protein QEH68_22230 (plasmid) [Paenarthrobacter sp. OM7]|uniref:hypothetical protein n=1 Tax=Paenarthrobacter sp. OM7 TaxID=3041264 RepID=UPI00246860FD|nr:hypothetical protein [Paenarthrobacter sp. OM7]WGM22848.1 hypothetical protein QEH68_22230 [Paenarthrobacter sp. OM7]
MARYRITITNVVEMDQEALQEAALEFPTVKAGLRQEAEISVATTADPQHAGFLLGLELHNQMLMLLRGRRPVVPSGVPDVQVERLPDPGGTG